MLAKAPSLTNIPLPKEPHPVGPGPWIVNPAISALIPAPFTNTMLESGSDAIGNVEGD